MTTMLLPTVVRRAALLAGAGLLSLGLALPAAPATAETLVIAVPRTPEGTFQNPPIVLDPVYNMHLLTHSEGVSNRAKYDNPEVDRLIDEARRSMDSEARLEMMREAQRIWMEDSPWIMTVYASAFEAMSPDIVGWVGHPDTHERWHDLSLAD